MTRSIMTARLPGSAKCRAISRLRLSYALFLAIAISQWQPDTKNSAVWLAVADFYLSPVVTNNTVCNGKTQAKTFTIFAPRSGFFAAVKSLKNVR